MKFSVTFKTPDAKNDALEDLRKEHGDEVGDGEAEAVVMDKFIQYGEYVTIEFDSEAGTAVVERVR